MPYNSDSMKIENERYNILSKGKDQPEQLPDENQTVELYVTLKGETTTPKDHSTLNARFDAKYVELLGDVDDSIRYALLQGRSEIDRTSLPSTARYLVNANRDEGEIIGELVRKAMIR